MVVLEVDRFKIPHTHENSGFRQLGSAEEINF